MNHMNHKHTARNKDELRRSDKCGCCFCCKVLHPNDIKDWVDKGQTALCPECGVDAIIGDGSGISITTDFLIDMYRKWFML